MIGIGLALVGVVVVWLVVTRRRREREQYVSDRRRAELRAIVSASDRGWD